MIQSREEISKKPNPRDKKTRKKAVTQLINRPLVALNSSMKPYYERAMSCSSVLYQQGDKLTSRYCNCRTCLTCNGIRTASYIKYYSKQLLSFKEPQFITLTAPTVQCYDTETLRHFIDAREYSWRRIYENARLKHKGVIELKGMKSMEITARPDDYYHIHFHFIVEGHQNALWIKKQWLRLNKSAEPYLQVIKPLKNEQGLLEVFKYGTKFIDKEKKVVNGKVVEHYKQVEPRRMDLIISALKGKRLVSTFGGVKRMQDEDVNELVESVSMEGLEEEEYRIWYWKEEDWYDKLTNEKFSDFVISEKLRSVFVRADG